MCVCFLEIGLRNLCQIILGIVRVVAVRNFGGVVGVIGVLVKLRILRYLRVFGIVSSRERRFVASAPVVFKLARAPSALELGSPGIPYSIVVEIP